MRVCHIPLVYASQLFSKLSREMSPGEAVRSLQVNQRVDVGICCLAISAMQWVILRSSEDSGCGITRTKCNQGSTLLLCIIRTHHDQLLSAAEPLAAAVWQSQHFTGICKPTRAFGQSGSFNEKGYKAGADLALTCETNQSPHAVAMPYLHTV